MAGEIGENFTEELAFKLSTNQVGFHLAELKEHSIGREECTQRQEDGRFVDHQVA